MGEDPMPATLLTKSMWSKPRAQDGRIVSIFGRDIDLGRTERRLRASMHESEWLFALIMCDVHPDFLECSKVALCGKLRIIESTNPNEITRLNGVLVFALLYKLRAEMITGGKTIFCGVGTEHLSIQMWGSVESYFYRIDRISTLPDKLPFGALILKADNYR